MSVRRESCNQRVRPSDYIFVFLRMFGPQIDEYNTSIESNITCSTPMVIQFDIDESATQYTGKIEDYFEGIPRTESGPRYK